MFRVKKFEVQRTDFIAVIALPALLAVVVLSVGSAILAVHEYMLLLRLTDAGPVSSTVEVLREGAWRRVFLALAFLCATLVAAPVLWVIRRRYLSSQRSLMRVKVSAHDILASMDQGVVTTDAHGNITSVNTAATRLLNVDFDCVGKPLATICTEQLPLTQLMQQVFERQCPIQDQDLSMNQDGRLLRLRADAHLLRDTAGKSSGCVVHLRDVTARSLLEERMRRMERFIGLGALASGLHHEIKNPLTALSIHVQLLEEKLVELDVVEPVNDLLGVLKAEVVRLNGVLESFRSFAHLQSLRTRPTDVLEVLERVIRLIRPQALAQNVNISLLHPPTQLAAVPLDAERFEQAALNLIINALEAMPSGGTLTLRARLDNGSLLVEIEDSGAGIAPEVQRHVFQPYFSTKGKGTGMGLAITEKIVSQHGGHIDFATGPAGTVFRLSFPLHQNGESA